MHQLRTSTSQQSAVDNNTSVQSEKAKRKIVKIAKPDKVSKWLGKKPEIPPSLTHETIKKQIGNCTICFRLPKPDIVQLPACFCIFCRDCFYQYLDRFARPTPVVKKVWLPRDPSDRKRWDRKILKVLSTPFRLSFEGNVLPPPVKTLKPNVIKRAQDLDSRNRVINHKLPDDQNWYRIVKRECFDCPNCHQDYDDINRSDLKRNIAVSDILQQMLENEKAEKIANNSTDKK